MPEMEKYLGETYGVMVYQEDVIKVAHHIVGLTLEESDLLRRAMSGKMRSHKAMQLVVDKFFVCCKTGRRQNNGEDEENADCCDSFRIHRLFPCHTLCYQKKAPIKFKMFSEILM